jgi:hypothetical protein
VPYFRCGGHKVWGATAMILAELAAVWREAGVMEAAGDAGGAWDTAGGAA